MYISIFSNLIMKMEGQLLIYNNLNLTLIQYSSYYKNSINRK